MPTTIISEQSPLAHALALVEGFTARPMATQSAETVLNHVSGMLSLHGVTTVDLKGGRLYFVDRGDPYLTTLTYRPHREPQFKLEAWGDVLETEGSAG